jgi:hypothetical protein
MKFLAACFFLVSSFFDFEYGDNTCFLWNVGGILHELHGITAYKNGIDHRHRCENHKYNRILSLQTKIFLISFISVFKHILL